MGLIFDFRMHDGSRNFTDLPLSRDWYEVRDHVSALTGAILTGFVTDDVTEAWIDFSYRGHRFSINNQYGDYWFFVDDPACPDEILTLVRSHWASLLEPAPP